MASILIGSLALSVDSFKSKRRQRRERRAQDLQRSLSEAGPSTQPTMAIGDDEPSAQSSEAARAKAREAYEQRELSHADADSADEHEHEHEHDATTPDSPEAYTAQNPALPPPYADAPEYGAHKQDTLLSSTPRRRRRRPSRRASAGDVAFDTRAGPGTGGRQFFNGTDTNGVQRERSPVREGETEAQRRKRKEREFWSLKSGAFWGLMGVSLARSIATC